VKSDQGSAYCGHVQLLTYSPGSPSMVTLEVGNRASGRYTFRVHESILCGLDFFKAALQGSFLEATTKLIKMPEDDPVFMAPFVEFLYSKDYQEPVLTEIKGDGAHLKKRFTQKLYHAGVLVLGEKYGLEGLCAVAVSYMRSTSTKLEASSTTGDNANFLEYVVQLYNMSAPGSALRIPKTEDTRVTVLKPIAWDTRRAGRWIGSMWKDEVQRPLVKEAFERCPDLAQDLLIMISSGLGNNANSGAKPSCKGKTVSLEGQKIFF